MQSITFGQQKVDFAKQDAQILAHKLATTADLPSRTFERALSEEAWKATGVLHDVLEIAKREKRETLASAVDEYGAGLSGISRKVFEVLRRVMRIDGLDKFKAEASAYAETRQYQGSPERIAKDLVKQDQPKEVFDAIRVLTNLEGEHPPSSLLAVFDLLTTRLWMKGSDPLALKTLIDRIREQNPTLFSRIQRLASETQIQAIKEGKKVDSDTKFSELYESLDHAPNAYAWTV